MGTEPFWAATVDGATVTYSTPDFPGGVRVALRRQDSATGATLTATLDGKPLMLDIRPGGCSDGMSDRVYRYRAVRMVGTETAQGCADSVAAQQEPHEGSARP